MKKNLLVTLADKNYVDQAKQLFSSVYFNAGWKGDYMLLAHEIPEKKLKWFREKGILVRKCKPLYNKKVGVYNHPPVVFSKFYLFTPEFKKWEHIIFLDADIIVRASLDELTKIKGFAAHYAIRDFFHYIKLSNQFIGKSDVGMWERLRKNYDMDPYSFNSGVMAFNASIIKNDSFSKLKKLLYLHGKISSFGEEGILNLFFYIKWKKLPYVYSVFPYSTEFFFGVKCNKIKGAVLHFAGLKNSKPWIPGNYFYKEWKHNLKMTELIDLNKIQPGKKWSKLQIEMYSLYFKLINLYHRAWYLFHVVYRILRRLRQKFIEITYKTLYLPDRVAGLIGIFLKRRNTKLYLKLRCIRRIKLKHFRYVSNENNASKEILQQNLD